MSSTIDLSPATAARLRSLRWRVTALIALLALVGVTVFAVVVIRLDRELRDEQIDTELLRLGDSVDQEVSFVDGALEPGEPQLDSVVLAVNPSFSVREFEEQQDRFGLREPTDEELRELIGEIVEDADVDSQSFLLTEALISTEELAIVDRVDVIELAEEGVVFVEAFEFEDGDETVFVDEREIVRDELLQVILDDPPGELFDEAYRRFVFEQADDVGVELEFETALLAGQRVDIDPELLLEIGDEVSDDGATVERTIDALRGDPRVIRAVALRDGPEIRGAAIAVLDPTEFDDAHASLRNQVILLAIVIVVGSTIAAWFVAGRTTRPVARALGQQERFLADAAHELRTPIAAIRLTAESADDGTATESLSRVAELAADASTLTDDLLTLARMDADRLQLQRDRVRMDLLVESTVAAIPGADEVVRVEIGDAVVALVDPGLVERALGNLVRNAMSHGDASTQEPAVVTLVATDSAVAVRVHDHGPGVDPGVADELFERFRSSTGSSGHGLGLPLARWIARAHGGDLVLVDTAGDGTTFELTLPR